MYVEGYLTYRLGATIIKVKTINLNLNVFFKGELRTGNGQSRYVCCVRKKNHSVLVRLESLSIRSFTAV